MEKRSIFISSVQKEFESERLLLCNYIRQDALLGKYFVPFIFEELPAANQTDNFRTIFWRNTETLNENAETLNENAETLNENAETLNENTETLNENAETLRPNLETSSVDIENITENHVKSLRPNLETLRPNLETLKPNLETLKPLQGLPKRMTRKALEEVILTLCSHEYLTVNQISKLVGKSSAYLLNEIIPSLIANQKLIRLFPATPNHQNQAYKKSEMNKL